MYQLFRSSLFMAASVRCASSRFAPRPSLWLPPRPEDRLVPTVGKSAPAQCLTSDMVLVHKVFRRELRLLAVLISDAGLGDLQRATALAAHSDELATALRHHHQAEQDLLLAQAARSRAAGSGGRGAAGALPSSAR